MKPIFCAYKLKSHPCGGGWRKLADNWDDALWGFLKILFLPLSLYLVCEVGIGGGESKL